jgi:DNA polymerase III subunit delta
MAKTGANSNSFQGISSEISSGNFYPIYFFEGDEAFFIDALSDLIEEKALTRDEKEFNFFVFYGRDVKMPDIISQAKRFPMFSERQVIIVKEAQDLEDLETKVEVKIGGKRKEINILEEYLNQPVPTTTLVFCHKYDKIDGKFSMAKKVRNLPGYFSADPLKEYQIPKWIEDYLRLQKIKINSNAAQMLCDYLGSDLSKIANEVSKLKLLLKPGDEITVALVDANIGISKEFNVFELQKALSSKDVLKAYRIVEYFAANKKVNSIFMVLGNLYSYFNKVFLYHVAPEPRSELALAGILGVPPFFVKDFVSAAKNYPLQKIPYIMSSLREADTRLKGSDGFSLDEEEIYQELLFKIFNG